MAKRWWNLSGLWERTDDAGDVYLVGTLDRGGPEAVEILVQRNPHKREPWQPDYVLLVDRDPESWLSARLRQFARVFHRHRRRAPPEPQEPGGDTINF